MAKTKEQEQEFPFAAADVAAQLVRWLAHLGAERRMSALTVEAYRGDVARFLAFLAQHLGRPPSLAALARIEVRDVRAFMSARRTEGISSRSLMRALAAVRSFARFLERNGRGKVGALAAVRSPKIPRTLPKPLGVGAEKRPTHPETRAGGPEAAGGGRRKAPYRRGTARGRRARAVDLRPRRGRAGAALRLRP